MLTRVAAPYTVEIQWTEPAEPNGIVTAYTVYVSQQPDINLGDSGAPELTEPFTKVRLFIEITLIGHTEKKLPIFAIERLWKYWISQYYSA